MKAEKNEQQEDEGLRGDSRYSQGLEWVEAYEEQRRKLTFRDAAISGIYFIVAPFVLFIASALVFGVFTALGVSGQDIDGILLAIAVGSGLLCVVVIMWHRHHVDHDTEEQIARWKAAHRRPHRPLRK